MFVPAALLILLAGCAPDPGEGAKETQESALGDTADLETASDTNEAIDTAGGETGALDQDADGDGSPDGDDCADADAAVFPGAMEACNGRDDDCDGEVDEGVETVWYGDADNDGYGDVTSEASGCTAPAGASAVGTDCDDTDAAVNPGAADDVCDGIDQDCNGCDRCGGLCSADAVLFGESPNDLAGLGAIGDLDGDGVGDLVLVSQSHSGKDAGTNSGAAYVVRGPIHGRTDLVDADARIYGSTEIDHLGSAAAADLDGDGAAELLLGAWYAGDGGEVYLFDGALSGTFDTSAADAVLTAPTDAQAGNCLVAADVDGDGRLNLLIGAPGYGGLADHGGAVFVADTPLAASGSLADAGASVVGDLYYGLAGQVVTGGDVDADGVDDVLIGQPWSGEGAVYIHIGPLSGMSLLSEADAVLSGEPESGRAGSSVSVADMNGDGVGDVVTGATYSYTDDPWAGAAYVVSGPVAGAYNLADADVRLLGEQAMDNAGYVATGDADGDTLVDLFVGAPGESSSEPRAGAVYVVLSPVSGTISLAEADAKWLGAAASDESSVAAVGDLDGDGVVELLGWGEGREDARAGVTYLVYGGGL